MNHRRRMKRALTALQREELSDTVRQRLETHVAQCPTCRDTLRQWETADRLLHAVRPQPVALTADAAHAVFARALQQSGVQPTGHPRPDWRRSLLWGFGLTCLAFIVLVPIRHRAPRNLKVTGGDQGRTYASMIPQQSAWSHTSPQVKDPSAGVANGASISDRTALPSQRHDLDAAHPLRRQRHQWTSMIAAIHHRSRHHRRRHNGSLPLSETAPVFETAPVETSPIETSPIIAAATIEPREPQQPEGRLLVVVTHEPGLPVEVTHTTEDAPGYAQASCFRRDASGAEMWQRCTVRKDETGADTVHTQIALATPGLHPELLMVQTATGAGDRTGTDYKKERVE